MQDDVFRKAVQAREEIVNKIDKLKDEQRNKEEIVLQGIFEDDMRQYLTINWSKLTQDIQSNWI